MVLWRLSSHLPKDDIVYSLIDIVKYLNSPPRSIKDALKALFGISLYPLNRPTAIRLGISSVLFNFIAREGRIGIPEDATAVIAQISGCEEAAEEFAKVSGLSTRIKENAVSGLLNLGRCGGETVVEEIWKWCLAETGFGVLEGISEVAENGSEKGKSKASALLKIVDGEFPRIVGSGSESECGSVIGSSSGVDLSENHRFVYLMQDSS